MILKYKQVSHRRQRDICTLIPSNPILVSALSWSTTNVDLGNHPSMVDSALNQEALFPIRLLLFLERLGTICRTM